MNKKLVVFVHGWGVTDTETYGGFPERLQREAEQSGLDIDVRNIWIGEYISFRDEVRVPDLVKALDRAIQKQLGSALRRGLRFACITHSTGGPIVRAWWHHYYLFGRRRACPMSHLIMLAPANFGSALAQLGKGKLARLKGFFQGIDPGAGVLNWLELGSAEAWALNQQWIEAPETIKGAAPVFPFVLAGQSIDRAFYDHLNSYTGEMGSDGVVRVAAANLNSAYVRLEQDRISGRTVPANKRLKLTEAKKSQAAAFALVKGVAHSGDDMGIMRSVPAGARRHATVDLVIECLAVESARDYRAITRRFAERNAAVIANERVEVEERRWPLSPRFFVHDQCSMVMFRLTDNEGFPVTDFRLLLTAEDNDPNQLPPKFLIDRQKNKLNRNTLTYYFNHDVLAGAPAAIKTIRGKRHIARARQFGIKRLGFQLMAEPSDGFAHYIAASLNSQARLIGRLIQSRQTTMIDVVVNRVVRESAAELVNLDTGPYPQSFKRRDPAGEVIDR